MAAGWLETQGSRFPASTRCRTVVAKCSNLEPLQASSKAAPFRRYSLSAGGPKGAGSCRSYRLVGARVRISNGHGPWGWWAVWQVCGGCGFPLLRASVSPNGGVAGFRQTFSAVVACNRRRRCCVEAAGCLQQSGKKKLAGLFILSAPTDT